MGWLDAFCAAKEAFTQRRLKLLDHPDPIQPPTPSRGTVCRRCGCDPLTCTELGCPPQPDSQTEDSLRGHDDARNAWTNYERRAHG